MKLTIVERWILSNQLKILSIIDDDQKDYYEYTKKIIERGYELLYDESVPYIYDNDEVLTEEQCKLVLDILTMFEMINIALRSFEDKTDINVPSLEFAGFDANNEGKYYLFARFFCKEYDTPRFEGIGEGNDGFNSHFPVLDAYVRMLEVWQNCENKYSLTKQDLIRISDASIHPSKR